MSFKHDYPDFGAIEIHIRRAHAERQVYIATAIANGIFAVAKGTVRLLKSLGAGVAAERDRRAIEADAFLKRSVPKY